MHHETMQKVGRHERVVEEIRRRIEGIVYDTVEAKVAAVNAFLAELDSDPARVQTLCGWAWIHAAFDALPVAAPSAA